MNNNLTELIMILDMSGSMHNLTDDTIGGYNSLIEEQKKQEGDANVTTVLFDNRYILLYDRKNIKDVPALTNKEYRPSGTTAMLDAIGKTLVDVGLKLDQTPEEERPGKVIVTIITDGYENASKEFDWATIKNMIKEQREKYNWVFSFIGADIDNIQVSNSLGIDHRLSRKYSKMDGTASVYMSVSKAMSKMRNVSYDTMDDLVNDISKDLDEIK